ncbi:uncharacterized protein LOC112085172 [Eutrema salsugineum]|uniref:uncharacterized protein LOC112085172 n=1 Tax=Eutrema salsugineum TaxID=72664 RepID=UPI000CED0349|nr:uncharacterized protein LOC112085172 [Eutrema salsugineum]
MAQIPVVYGEWKFKENSWHFVVDIGKGGRMWFLNDGCTFGQLTEMARDDYNLGKKTEIIELTYALPVSMLQNMAPDTPPMHVTNDRQVSSLIALSRVHLLRLCVSCRVEMDTEENQERSDEEFGEDVEENSEHSTDDEADSSDVNDDGEDVDDATYSDGEDYSVYGKVKDEDDDEDEVCIEKVRTRYGETGSTPMSWSDNIYVGASFPTKEKLLSEVRLTAIMLKFAFKTQKSTKNLFVAKCRVEGCAWMVRASVKNEASTFWVTKYVKDYTCSIAHRMAHRGKSTPKYIGQLFISYFGIIDGLTPEHVRVSMKHMFSIRMDYTTSYRSLIYAQQLVRGTAEDGYASLPAYLHSVNKANPGTVSALHVDSNNKFKYLFLAFGASIAGFQYMRRVIVVDGCHLTGKYEDGYPLVIVSDRHISIKKACETIFPWAKRGICYYHLQHNIVTKFRGKQLLYLVKRVAYAYNLYDYNRYMAELRQIKPDLADYLEEADVSLWSRVHFVGDRYNIKTSNIAESINAALKKARGYPISFFLDFIREKLGWWFLKRREDALSLTTHNTRGVEYLLVIRGHYADAMEVDRIDTWRYYVKGGTRNCIVDLEHGMCECGVFYIEKIPCSHAIAAALAGGVCVDSLVCPTY